MSKHPFAPLPPRVLGDGRLSALDLRVLAAIAVHDRFSKNGIGSTAGHGRLAGLTNCHMKSLSRSLRTLAECGYIGGRANPLNPKSRCYFVIYNDFDPAYLKSVTGNEMVTSKGSGTENKTGLSGNQPVTSNEVSGNHLVTSRVTNSFPIGNHVEKIDLQNQDVIEYNILSEALNKSCETAELNSAEAAPVAQKGAFERAPGSSVGASLSMAERALKRGVSEDDLWRHCGVVDDLLSRMRPDDPNYGWAKRISEQFWEKLDAA